MLKKWLVSVILVRIDHCLSALVCKFSYICFVFFSSKLTEVHNNNNNARLIYCSPLGIIYVNRKF